MWAAGQPVDLPVDHPCGQVKNPTNYILAAVSKRGKGMV